MQHYKELIEGRIDAWCMSLPSNALYAPMSYMLRLPAKRVRPIATLMACELFGRRAEDALDEALGIELFHNFTLIHDDIMDASPLRRGQPTVHVKWDANTAILSGDALLVKAYQLMGLDPRVLALFGRHALEVCEGQELDMQYAQRADVNTAEYMEMIRLKTASLLACALKIGATIGGANAADLEHIGHFGERLGMAFQLRDDLLDAFGDPKETGKQRGGDLRNGKKTWLLIRGLERERSEGSSTLHDQLAKPMDQRDALQMIETIERLGARGDAESEVRTHEQHAFAALDGLGVVEKRKEDLLALAKALMGRRS